MGTCLKVWLVWAHHSSVDPSVARRHEVIRSRSLGTGSTNGRKNLMEARLEKKLELRSSNSSGQEAIKALVGGVGQTKQQQAVLMLSIARPPWIRSRPILLVINERIVFRATFLTDSEDFNLQGDDKDSVLQPLMQPGGIAASSRCNSYQGPGRKSRVKNSSCGSGSLEAQA